MKRKQFAQLYLVILQSNVDVFDFYLLFSTHSKIKLSKYYWHKTSKYVLIKQH